MKQENIMGLYKIQTWRKATWTLHEEEWHEIEANSLGEARNKAKSIAEDGDLYCCDADLDNDYVSLGLVEEMTDNRNNLGLSDSDLELFNWLITAIDLTNRMESIRNVHVLNNVVQATNWHVLFWCDLPLGDGLYTKMGNPTTCDKSFPDTSRVVPNYDDFQEITIERRGNKAVDINKDVRLQCKYLDMLGNVGEWLVALENPSSPARFKHKTTSKQAVIMPYRGDL